MTLTRRTILPLFLLVAALQTAALGYIVVGRDRLIKNGREIVMQVQPLDPRDLFRGDYVTLGYPITQFNIAGEQLPDGVERGGAFYAVLRKGENDAWSVARVAASYPKDAAADEAVIRGRVQNVYTGPEGKGYTLNGRYGIETYFVEEGKGRKIEEGVREHTVKAILAVGSDGEAALKGLIVDDVRTDYPPIF